MSRRFSRILSVVLATAAITALAVSTGRACFMYSPQPVTVWLDHIRVDIRDQVAVKQYDCTFKNPNPQAIVGAVCYMELEPGAQVDDMSVLVDGKEMRAEILDVDKAKEVFTDIVKKGGSPALLEYFGNQLIQTQVPRIPANGTVKVVLKYTTVLQNRGGLVRLQMLNTNPKALMQPLQSASVKVNITSSQPIKNVYSPTHKIKLVEEEGADVSVEWSQENYLPKHPFVLYYQVSEDAVGASLLAHRELGEEGTFMLMLSPTVGEGAGAVSDADIMPKDVVFCVDTSGSMLEGNKMEQARAALKYCVENLRGGDRFNIVDFSTSVRVFDESGMVAVDDASRQRALKYIDRLAARGGTAINDALEKSLSLLREGDRLKMILFATDGLPTIGERDPEAILRRVNKENTSNVRLFVFGEGFDVNTKLLDFLALTNRGEAEYILPEEDIRAKIAKFYDRVGSPVMTDIQLDFGDLSVKDVFPDKIPDLFKAEQVVIFGRYEGSGTKTIRLSGMLQGQRRTLEYQVHFPETTDDEKASFVPRLWAGRKIDFLLNEMRKSNTEDKELVAEIIFLAKRYGIVTPYTSYLMAEDIVVGGGGGPGRPVPMPVLQNQILGRLRAEKAATAPGAPEADRANAVRQARELGAARRGFGQSGAADALYEAADEALRDARGKQAGSALAAIRHIGSKTFYQADGVWYDSTYDVEKVKDPVVVPVGSEKFFQLLDEHPELAKYMALSNVVLNFKGTWYRFETKQP